MILTPDVLRRRLSRLQALVAYLDRIPAVDCTTYSADIAMQLRIERVIQLAAQIVADALETLPGIEDPRQRDNPKPLSHAEAMEFLVQRGILSQSLAAEIADLPTLAEHLAHENVEVSPAEVWRVWTQRRRSLAAAAAAFASRSAIKGGRRP